MIESLAERFPHLKSALHQDTWGYDKTWMVGPVRETKELGRDVQTWTQKYLTAMSLGPWRIQGQVHQKNLLLSQVRDAEWSTLSPLTVAALPFRLRWQTQQTTDFHRNLLRSGSTLDALCEHLLSLTGDAAYHKLADMSGVRGYSKCVDFFVREALLLDCVPVDRHVRRLLASFDLTGVGRLELTELIREAGFKPRLVARVLYEQGLNKSNACPTIRSSRCASERR
ncbi:MAG: hypothetical protein A3H35_03005 [Betaproteobacteria bacterium RIFCSPLOWO2_02_FULL_62_17]|nr:MAG: hypothetical protein A3H35_03005 [Betaproteobacteria bacterium RIFCSPLOWO2_02_FULL_62_17]